MCLDVLGCVQKEQHLARGKYVECIEISIKIRKKYCSRIRKGEKNIVSVETRKIFCFFHCLAYAYLTCLGLMTYLLIYSLCKWGPTFGLEPDHAVLDSRHMQVGSHTLSPLHHPGPRNKVRKFGLLKRHYVANSVLFRSFFQTSTNFISQSSYISCEMLIITKF